MDHLPRSDQQEIVAESCCPQQSLWWPGCPSHWHLSTFWASGKVGGRLLGEKMTISDTGNKVCPRDLRISNMCGHYSFQWLQPTLTFRERGPCAKCPGSISLVWFSGRTLIPTLILAHPSLSTPVDFCNTLTSGPTQKGEGGCLWSHPWSRVLGRKNPPPAEGLKAWLL